MHHMSYWGTVGSDTSAHLRRTACCRNNLETFQQWWAFFSACAGWELHWIEWAAILDPAGLLWLNNLENCCVGSVPGLLPNNGTVASSSRQHTPTDHQGSRTTWETFFFSRLYISLLDQTYSNLQLNAAEGKWSSITWAWIFWQSF